MAAGQDPGCLLSDFASQANAIKTLPREFNSYYQAQTPDQAMDSYMRTIHADAANRKRVRPRPGESNFEFASLQRSANFPRKMSGAGRMNENKYTVHANGTNYPVVNMDHIYESIDSESSASAMYDQNNRRINMNMFNFYPPNNVNCRSKSTLNDDDLSSSSIYEDKPLLMAGNGSIQNRRPFMTSHYHSNASIYDKGLKDQAARQMEQHLSSMHPSQVDSMWQHMAAQSKDANGLPDLLQQKPNQNNLIVSYSGENKFMNKVVTQSAMGKQQ